MILALYNLLWQLARPLLLRKLSRRGQAEPLYLHAVHQRFARYTDQERQQAQTHAGQWVWLHAVSLGETRAADILLQALRAVQPGMRLLLTHGTATGRQAGQKLLREGDMQVWLPWDERGAVQRFVQTFRPRLGLIMETEIWLQLLQACGQQEVPVVLVNARLSEKTLRQWQRLPQLARQSYGRLSVAYAQTAQDAQRLQTLGVPAVMVTGNLKFDASPDPVLLQQGQDLRRRWHAQQRAARPVALLASSRDGEETLWLQAWQALPPEQRDAVQWLIVPRHPQRFDEVAHLLRTTGFAVKRRSTGQTDPDDGRQAVWLGDSMGEMPLYYAMADLALMGGSFAPLGGQNLIEACACAGPVLLGPHTFNFSQASEQAIAAGAALRCNSMEQAVQQALALLSTAPAETGASDSTRAAMQRAALVFSQAHRGAAQRMTSDLHQRGWLG